MVRTEVIETSTYRWQRYVLPLNYARIKMVDRERFELSYQKMLDPKSSASTYFATWPFKSQIC